MKMILRTLVVFGMTIGLSLFSSIPMVQTQEKPTEQRAGQQEVSDKELRAFAKSYIKFHRLRAEYQPILDTVHDPQVKGKMEQEALAKFSEAVEKEGLTLEGYARIFQAVNADEKLREKAIKLIEEERRKA
jgi:hypothetical protein